jgi:hypothetical protein
MLGSFKFKPVAWLTSVVTVLVAVEAVNETAHLLPERWTPYLLGTIAVLTAALGALTHGAVTPLARPRDDAGNALVPKWAAGDTKAPPSTPGGGVDGAGMRSW